MILQFPTAKVPSTLMLMLSPVDLPLDVLQSLTYHSTPLLPYTRHKKQTTFYRYLSLLEGVVQPILHHHNGNNTHCRVTREYGLNCGWLTMFPVTNIYQYIPLSEMVAVPILPPSFHQVAFAQNHDAPTAGHQGFEHTLSSRIKQEAYYVNMAKEDKCQCRECTKCQQSKVSVT